jgi:MFS family permease
MATARARIAVVAVFAVNGVSLGSWLSRVPAVRDDLQLSPSQLGLLLLCPGLGSMVGLPVAGWVVTRVGPARGVLAGAAGVTTGLLCICAGLLTDTAVLAAAGLTTYGFSVSVWDVAMNVAGADLEHRVGRTLLPRMHAGLSLGAAAGAGLGAAAAALGVAVVAQFLVTASVVVGVVCIAVRFFLPAAREPEQRTRGALGRAWREPRTLAIGVLVLAFALTEGIANDWLALALTDGHHTSQAVGAAGYAVFVTAVTAGRAFGGSLLQRAGRVMTLRILACTGAAGVLLVVFTDPLPLVLLGAVLWGTGASLGFPVGMSAAADDMAVAAVRVSVVSSLGYTAFFAGPPLVGFLADTVGVRRALLTVLAALAVACVTAAATKPRHRSAVTAAQSGRTV